ncbi:MAG: type II toxin-antitoxin system RelE/ParE family toxin [Gammaproteobacteria bacterium]|nr:type II toxin-antitoxin system RelE/ParE family toxin [Gammaproteobacteria bacterium]
MKVTIKKQLEIYIDEHGRVPFVMWLESLKDKTVRYRIKERLDRIALGNLGDFKRINGSLGELRCNFGAGYRIYYGEIGRKIVLLLCCGSKSTQKRDIKQAMKYWKDYLSR